VLAQIIRKKTIPRIPKIGGHSKRINPPSPGSEPVGRLAIIKDRNVEMTIINIPLNIFINTFLNY